MTTSTITMAGQFVDNRAPVTISRNNTGEEQSDAGGNPQDVSTAGSELKAEGKPDNGFIEFLKKVKNSESAKRFADIITAYDRPEATTGEKAGKFLIDTTVGAGTGAVILAGGGTAVTVGSTLLGAAVLGAAGGFFGFLIGGFAGGADGSEKGSKIGGYGGALVGGTAAYVSSKAYAKMVSDLAAQFGASAAGGAMAGGVTSGLYSAIKWAMSYGHH